MEARETRVNQDLRAKRVNVVRMEMLVAMVPRETRVAQVYQDLQVSQDVKVKRET